jgi:hypothetical protein
VNVIFHIKRRFELHNEIGCAWVLERFKAGVKLFVSFKEDSDGKIVSGILKEVTELGLSVQGFSDPLLIFILFEVIESIWIDNLSCSHFYLDGRGAVEPICFPIRDFKSKKIVEFQVVIENDVEVGYCLICGSKQPANLSLEQVPAYQSAMKEYDCQ